jgi:hypothetical protein
MGWFRFVVSSQPADITSLSVVSWRLSHRAPPLWIGSSFRFLYTLGWASNSEEFLQLLNKLGADPLKEWEEFDYDGFERPGTHVYRGWFLFSGEIAHGLVERIKGTERTFRYGFTSSFPNGQG